MKPRLASWKKCTGCSACYASCPRSAINMEPDSLGFLHPKVNASLCSECGLCEKRCPALAINKAAYPLGCFAAKSFDKEILSKSSSGGLFFEMARKVLKDNGVVYGCILDADLKAIHVRADTEKQVALMRGSKYVQSDLKDVFKDVASDLTNDRFVLFTGTPCQVSGLKHFLGKSYEKLIAVGLICHGVPAPEMFEFYKQEEEDVAGAKLKDFSFRSKHYSWREFSISLMFDNAKKNKFISQYGGSYMCLFNRNYMMRESCFHCPTRTGRSGCDLLIGDYWGVEREHPEVDLSLGVSCVLAYSEAGLRLIRALPLDRVETKYDQIIRANRNVENNPKRPFGIDFFRSNFRAKTFDAWTKWVFWGPWWFRPLCPVLHWPEFKSTWVKSCYHFVRDLFLWRIS